MLDVQGSCLIGWLTARGTRLVAILSGYGDESERPDGTFVVAGCVFSESEATGFSREWEPLFAPWGGCHWQELVQRKRRFAGISEEKRDELVVAAIKCLIRWTGCGAVVTCNLDDVRYMRSHFDDFMKPYGICCSMLVTLIAGLLRRQARDDTVMWTFESGREGHSQVHDLFTMVEANARLRDEYRLEGHAFVRKEACQFLQAPDAIAWEAGKFHSETIAKRGQPDQRLSRLSFSSYWMALRSRDAVTAHTAGVPGLFHHWKYLQQSKWRVQVDNLRKRRGLPPAT